MEALNLKVDIVSYDKAKVKIGVVLTYSGLGFLFLNAIPFIWTHVGMIIVYCALFLMFLGTILINYFLAKNIKIGEMIFDSVSTKVYVSMNCIELVNSATHVRFSKNGYEGKNNFKPFMTLGAFTTSFGINTICFYEENTKVEYEILVKTKAEYKILKKLLDEQFKK